MNKNIKLTCVYPNLYCRNSLYGGNWNKQDFTEDTKAIIRERPVAFYAYLSTVVNISSNQPIVYDLVKVNIGNGYNKYSGHFRAPVSGLYFFMNTVMSKPDHSIHVAIMKNGEGYSYNWADSYGYESGTAGMIMELDSGDVVYVKDTDGGSEFLHPRYNAFSGFLIQPY